MEFHRKLERELARRDWSQAKLAAMIDVAPSAVSGMIAGTRRPYMDQALAIARALGVPLDYLADDSIAGPPPAPDPELDRLIANARALYGGFAEANRRILNYGGGEGAIAGRIIERIELE